MNTNNRTSSRIRKELPLTFSNGDVRKKGMSSDFSWTGLFIITQHTFKPGTTVEMHLEVTVSNRIFLTGIVVHAIQTGIDGVKDGMGIKLTRMPRDYQIFLNSLEDSREL